MNFSRSAQTIEDSTEMSIQSRLRCLNCGSAMSCSLRCISCDRTYQEKDGIVEAIGRLTGQNRIAAEFYDGPGWVKFRPWEKMFLTLQGGQKRSRWQILRHIHTGASPLRILEVGIGDGENVKLLKAHQLYGLDIARTQLSRCQQRFPELKGRLFWGEAEALPFNEASFDACYSIGGFNHYRDRSAAWREMRRVTKPGGVIVIADELPTLFRAGIGHILGRPRLDAWWLRRLGLDSAFVDMVLASDLDINSLIADVSPTCRRLPIWNRLGYCLVDTAPSSSCAHNGAL